MEEYLKILLEQIRCNKARELVFDEVKNHILDQTEDNIKKGMSEEEAVRDAVIQMGDPVETGVAFDAVHRPQIAWGMIAWMGIISVLSILLHVFIGLDNAELGASYYQKHMVTILAGFAVMLILYRVDYSVMAKYGEIAAAIFLLFAFLAVFVFGQNVNGAVSWISLGEVMNISVIYIMYLYIPIYGAVLYQHHGEGIKGVITCIFWMLLPCMLANEIPSLRLMFFLFFAMALLLSIAVYKGWFAVNKKRFLVIFWLAITALPTLYIFCAILYRWFSGYQLERITMLISRSGYQSYQVNVVANLIQNSKLFGNSGDKIIGILPSYNSDYVFAFISSYYGIFAAFMIALILLFVIVKVFRIVFFQKNQLGMIMGCGCGIVFFVMTCLNLSTNLGISLFAVSLPFFSESGTSIIVCYILMGIVLSIYRYKNVLPNKLETGRAFKLSFTKRQSI